VVTMAILEELLDLSFDCYTMNPPIRVFKREEKQACMFDMENFIDLSSNISSGFAKQENYEPSICRLPAYNYRQPFFPAVPRLSHFGPYLNRKFLFLIFICFSLFLFA